MRDEAGFSHAGGDDLARRVLENIQRLLVAFIDLDRVDGGGFRIQDHLDAGLDVGTVQGSLGFSGFPDAGT